MKYTTILKSALMIILLVFCFGCKKGFLDEKPSSTLVVPHTLDDMQLLLNKSDFDQSPVELGELSSDECYADFSSFQSAAQIDRDIYTWNKTFSYNDLSFWSFPYSKIFYSNIVLQQMGNIVKNDANRDQYNNIKAQALFLRSNVYYNLLQVFSLPFDENTASIDLGVPLKLDASIDNIVQRSSVKAVYDQLIADLQNTVKNLDPNFQSVIKVQPSKPAGYMLLSKIFIDRREYSRAELYADSSLALYSKLIDYNTLDSTVSTPVLRENDETIFQQSQMSNTLLTSLRIAYVSDSLKKLYKPNDLRTAIFFKPTSDGRYQFKRGYSGNASKFCGFATDELYLIKSECLAREGKIDQAMDWLNRLLIKRWKSGTFIPYTANNQVDALNQILLERRKELVLRGVRWNDLRRLNKEGRAITLTRIVNGITYTLRPNDPRYALPIPDQEITRSGIVQNPR